MNFKGTVITHCNRHFGIALVRYSDFRHIKALKEIRRYCISYFKDVPFLIACEDAVGNPLYHGDQDLIQLLDEIKPSSITWEAHTA